MKPERSNAGTLAREFHFADRDFEKIRKLIYDYAGINLSSAKKTWCTASLRATGLTTFTDYLLYLESDNETKWELFVNSLTTNLTSLFREAHHFPILAEMCATCLNDAQSTFGAMPRRQEKNRTPLL